MESPLKSPPVSLSAFQTEWLGEEERERDLEKQEGEKFKEWKKGRQGADWAGERDG